MAPQDEDHKYQNVLFSAPPGSGGDLHSYFNEVKSALAKFSSPNGLFVFTSSGGVFTENSGKVVDENSDVESLEEPWTTRSQGILSAEKSVLKNSGQIPFKIFGASWPFFHYIMSSLYLQKIMNRADQIGHIFLIKSKRIKNMISSLLRKTQKYSTDFEH